MERLILILLYIVLIPFNVNLCFVFADKLSNGFDILDFLFLLLNVYMTLLNSGNVIRLILEKD